MKPRGVSWLCDNIIGREQSRVKYFFIYFPENWTNKIITDNKVQIKVFEVKKLSPKIAQVIIGKTK